MVSTYDSEPSAKLPGTPVCSPNLSVVMPCLNEAETLEQCILEAQRAAKESRIQLEVIVADNGSTDGSQQIARRCGARVVDVKTRGYGQALRCGIAAATGEFVLMGDSDASYDFGALSHFVSKLGDGNDLVMGNRFAGRIDPGAMPWKHRYIGNPVLSGVGRLFFRSGIGDFHCGLRAFRRGAIEKLHLTSDGMEFASEMVVKATMRGLRITEIPIVLRKDGRSRRPHLRSWRDGWRHLRFLLLFCPTWLYMVPAISMILIGGLPLASLAVAGPIKLGDVTVSINSALVCAMLTLLGNQLLLMGVFARRFGRFMNIWPNSGSHTVVRSWLSLEMGVGFGSIFVIAGFVGITVAGIDWFAKGMEPLRPYVTLSQVIPATMLVMMGVQTIFASFFLGLLGLAKREVGNVKPF